MARLVCVDGVLTWDKYQRLPGRGGYVHVDARCVSKMGQAQRWERVLRLDPGTLKGERVAEVTRALMSAAEGFVASNEARISDGKAGAPKAGGPAKKVRL